MRNVRPDKDLFNSSEKLKITYRVVVVNRYNALAKMQVLINSVKCYEIQSARQEKK